MTSNSVPTRSQPLATDHSTADEIAAQNPSPAASLSDAEALRHPARESADRPARTIVVGYDGSRAARAAVTEAGHRAGPAGRVFVVSAYAMPPGFLGSPYFDRLLHAARAKADSTLDQLFRDANRLPETDYVAELLGGPPAEAIKNVATARNADEIVVGSRRSRRLGVGLGGVLRKLLRTVRRPVSVIPAPALPQIPRTIAPSAATEPISVKSSIPPADSWW